MNKHKSLTYSYAPTRVRRTNARFFSIKYVFFGLAFLTVSIYSQKFCISYAFENQRADSTTNTDYDSNANSNDDLWVRLAVDGNTPTKLQTSIVRFQGDYVAKDGVSRPVSVDLIGAIHLAESEYYQQLNEQFKTYETLVFELILNKGADFKETIKIERESKKNSSKDLSLNPLNIIPLSQQIMSNCLNMVYQLDGVDYFAPNFRRGDMDSEDFILKLLTNGDILTFIQDSFFSGFLWDDRGLVESGMIAVFFAKDRRLALKRFLAIQLAESAQDDIKKATSKLEKNKLGASDHSQVDDGSENKKENVLIHYRNKKAIDVTKEELDAGQTKIGIFYGAAHLPDLAQRLENELHLKRVPEQIWLDAWNVGATNR